MARTRLFSKTVGTGRPVLILHGGWLDHRHMEETLEPVFERRPGWRRIYLDLPGHGRSQVGDAVACQMDVLCLVTDWLDRELGTGGLAVIGESRGGFLARGLVHLLPERIDGAMFIVPGRHAAAPAASLPEHRVLVRDDALVETLSPQERARWDRLVVRDAAILERIRRLKIPAAALADADCQRRIEASYDFPFDVDRPARPFDRPCLFLLGRQDAVSGYADALGVVERFPRATFAVLDRAGHSLAWEQPELFAALAAEWLRRVEEN